MRMVATVMIDESVIDSYVLSHLTLLPVLQASAAAQAHGGDGLLRQQPAAVHHPPCDREPCAAETRVAMHGDALALLTHHMVHLLHEREHQRARGSVHVAPPQVDETDLVRLELFRHVGKPRCGVDSVTAHRVLSGLLKVENGANVAVEELLNDAMLRHEQARGPLHRYHRVAHPLRAQHDETGVYVTVAQKQAGTVEDSV